MRYLGIFIFLLFVNLAFGQEDQESVKTERVLEAVRVDSPPKIDGILDDAVWKKAPIATDFIQDSPIPGKDASHPTEVRVLYDDFAIYIGATMYDVSSDSILRQLSQRDNEKNTDVFAFFLDTYDDDQSGYGFVVHPTGLLV